MAAADEWYEAQQVWHDEVAALRAIVATTGLTETIKWKHPCYTDGGKNIVLVGWRKDGAVISFLKGVLLDDPRSQLVQPGQDRSGRYLLYPTVGAIEADRDYVLGLIHQAVEVERAGRRVPPLPDEIDYVDELAERLAGDEAFRAAFEQLTPGRRRQYNLHVGKAKKAATRVARIAKAEERIFAGKGLTDCICGRSQRMPRCDGSHRR